MIFFSKQNQRDQRKDGDRDGEDDDDAVRSSDVRMPLLPKSLTLDEKKLLLCVERGDLSTVKKSVRVIFMPSSSISGTDYLISYVIYLLISISSEPSQKDLVLLSRFYRQFVVVCNRINVKTRDGAKIGRNH